MNQMKALCFFLLMFLAFDGYSQAVTWDSTHRPGNFAGRVDLFRSYPDSQKDIIFLGNSITAGVDWMELLGRADVRNRGISGDISFGVLERLHEVTEGKPARVFILIGINDISRNIPDSVILDNYKRMIRRIRQASPATKIFFQTLMPVNNQFTQFKNHYNKDEHIQRVNDGMKKLAAEEKIFLIDLHPHFLDAEKKLDKKYTMDGLHLNEAGYRHWASILKKGNYLDN
jgi:lysophospholipase L1-like esterase